MESEQEDPFSEHGSTAHLLGSAKPIAVGRRGGASTHSLNEADLQVRLWIQDWNDFLVLKFKFKILTSDFIHLVFLPEIFAKKISKSIKP